MLGGGVPAQPPSCQVAVLEWGEMAWYGPAGQSVTLRTCPLSLTLMMHGGIGQGLCQQKQLDLLGASLLCSQRNPLSPHLGPSGMMGRERANRLLGGKVISVSLGLTIDSPSRAPKDGEGSWLQCLMR